MEIVTSNELSSMVAKMKFVVVDFYADWCGPCKMMAPVLEAIAEVNKDIHFVKVNVDVEMELLSKLSVMSVPTLIFYLDGEVVGKLVGFQPKQKIIDYLNTIG